MASSVSTKKFYSTSPLVKNVAKSTISATSARPSAFVTMERASLMTFKLAYMFIASACLNDALRGQRTINNLDNLLILPNSTSTYPKPVSRLGDFLIFMVTNLLTKVAQILW